MEIKLIISIIYSIIGQKIKFTYKLKIIITINCI